MKKIDISGHRFGKLIALSRESKLDNGGRSRSMWTCQCDCGKTIVRDFEHLKHSTNCGCENIKNLRERSLKHGHTLNYSSSRTHKSWSHAKGRCHNPKDHKYPWYGARGITMCQEWFDDFRVFLRDMGECPPGRTIDRIDPNKGYEPSNCRWATSKEQGRTRTNNHHVTFNGRRMILKECAELNDVDYSSLHRRVKYLGESPETAVTILRGR